MRLRLDKTNETDKENLRNARFLRKNCELTFFYHALPCCLNSQYLHFVKQCARFLYWRSFMRTKKSLPEQRNLFMKQTDTNVGKFELAAKKKSEFINAEKPALAKGST